MPHSHHSHSGQFCLHAKSSLLEVVERARTLGFTHFHLSEHVPRQSERELYPEEVEASMTPNKLVATFEAYLIEARRLQSLTQDMHILVGCETENISSPATLDYLTSILGGTAADPASIGAGKVDYLVGSVHHSHGIPIDFDPPTFDKALASFEHEYDAFVEFYLDLHHETMQRLQPEVIGHFDLFRLFRPDAKVNAVSRVWDKVERNVRFAVSYGALFECNAAAFRKGWQTAYPGREILDLILSLNGRLCLSDDSHGVQAVALNYHRLREYLVDAGVTTVWYLEKAAPGTQPDFARGTVAKSLGVEWQDHPFWTRYEAVRKQEGLA